MLLLCHSKVVWHDSVCLEQHSIQLPTNLRLKIQKSWPIPVRLIFFLPLRTKTFLGQWDRLSFDMTKQVKTMLGIFQYCKITCHYDIYVVKLSLNMEIKFTPKCQHFHTNVKFQFSLQHFITVFMQECGSFPFDPLQRNSVITPKILWGMCSVAASADILVITF